jgi:predicted ATPase/DNA-binding XRE family transcriptional regulator
MPPVRPASFGAQLKVLREAAGFTQEELATIAGLSVHAVSSLERGERRRPQVETVRALSAALDLTGAARDALFGSARAPAENSASDVMSGVALPLPLTVLLGRESDLRTLRQWLADPAARLITLIGPGGGGTTRRVLELARAISTEGEARVVFVPLAGAGNAAFVASAVAEALGLCDVTAADIAKRARAACAGQPTVMVLDNFEHVLDAAPLVSDLLASIASLRVVATSRAPLRIRGEREYAVGPLALDVDADAKSPADLVRSPAVRLFVERVRDVQPEFRLTSENGATVTAICRRLDALPLALELAAPWIKVLTAENLRLRLEHDVLLASAGPRDLPERQQTMNAAVAWSYHLLDPAEQRAFRRFGALPGLFPLDAAAAVLAGAEGPSTGTEEALALTASLIDKSLLLRAETFGLEARPVYHMLETVRAFAALELVATRERDDATEGLLRFSRSEALLAADGLVGSAQGEWLDRVRQDLESHRGALMCLIDSGRCAEAADISSALQLFWLIRGHAVEGLRWYEQISMMPSLPPASASKVLAGAAVMLYAQGELDRARAAANSALALVGSGDDMITIGYAQNILGHVEHAIGNDSAARERFSKAVETFKAVEAHWGVGHALTGLAWVALSTGDPDEAGRRLDEADSVLEDTGPFFLLLGFYVRAILALRHGHPDEALALVRESLVRVKDLHDRFAFVYALVPLAVAAVLKGDHAWAARILGARDDVTERTGATAVDQSVQDLTEMVEREVRARLAPDEWTRAYAAGRRSSIDVLVKDIDRARVPATYSETS